MIGAWTFTDAVFFGGPVTLRTAGDLRAWMIMGGIERARAIMGFWSEGARRRIDEDISRWSRRPRTALHLLGPWAPPRPVFNAAVAKECAEWRGEFGMAAATGEWVLFLPGGQTKSLELHERERARLFPRGEP